MVLNNYIELLTSPATFFKKMDKVKTYFDPWLFFVIFTLFEVIFQLPLLLFSLLGSSGEEALLDALGIVFAFVLIPVTPFIASGIAHLGLMILGHKDYYKTFKPMTYALTISVPYSLVQTLIGGIALALGVQFMDNEISVPLAFGTIALVAIPAFILGIASTVHTVYATCVGAAYTHKISKMRAFCGMYLIPIALFTAIVVIPLIAITVALFGAAILSAPLS